MINNDYKIIIMRYKEIVEEIENFIENTSTSPTLELFDNLLIKFLEVFNFEKRFIDDTLHIEEHNAMLIQLVNIINFDRTVTEEWMKLLSDLLVVIKNHCEVYNSAEKEYSIISTVYNKHHGCMLYIIFEFGLFIKIYGTTDEVLLSEIEVKTNKYKEKLRYKENGWGEVVDVREWNLLTNNSLNRARKNTKEATERNKIFTYYMTGESHMNEFIASQILSSAEHLTFNTVTFTEIVKEMKRNNLKLGEIKAIDSVGNLAFVLKNRKLNKVNI